MASQPVENELGAGRFPGELGSQSMSISAESDESDQELPGLQENSESEADSDTVSECAESEEDNQFALAFRTIMQRNQLSPHTTTFVEEMEQPAAQQAETSPAAGRRQDRDLADGPGGSRAVRAGADPPHGRVGPGAESTGPATDPPPEQLTSSQQHSESALSQSEIERSNSDFVSQGSEFDVDAFILALAPGSYSISNTLAQWSTGDLEVVDRLLRQANLGVPNYQRIRSWWRRARPGIRAPQLNAIIDSRHRYLLASSAGSQRRRSGEQAEGQPSSESHAVDHSDGVPPAAVELAREEPAEDIAASGDSIPREHSDATALGADAGRAIAYAAAGGSIPDARNAGNCAGDSAPPEPAIARRRHGTTAGGRPLLPRAASRMQIFI